MAKKNKVPCPKCGRPMLKNSLSCVQCSRKIMRETMFRQNQREFQARKAGKVPGKDFPIVEGGKGR